MELKNLWPKRVVGIAALLVGFVIILISLFNLVSGGKTIASEVLTMVGAVFLMIGGFLNKKPK